MWKVSWLYEKVHDFLVVPLYYKAITVLEQCVASHVRILKDF